ncbi:hypothetical protein BKA70DRAFT_1248007 [Coprinopsis sp. MPI-PUGE-AT-0042]|nr:hypothetical protein BKA70DRAFT_1248007 [Coprinopsis sp. MPI-PUGE-AT-0042]
MTSIKLTTHNPLPAPAILSVTQSKSHVLAGVQDAYWSDEEEDAECPLCLEEMDVSDLNFKPCVCGYQICRFCWHHIKENLNKRCPACRRIYTDDAVEFKPVATQDHKRLTQQKKQREREKKELETLGRKSLANVRVVQRSVVYVTGIGPRFAKEELIPTLRSNEYFGQYGKISKILIVKRTPPGGNGPVIGLYITYHRREDAARAVAAVDGAPSPGGGREVMRASYGTTKYCIDHNCMNLHEWGDEKDCFTKEDLTTLKHTMKTTEIRSKTVMVGSKKDEDASLPRAASWGQKSIAPVPASTISGGLPAGVTSAMSRSNRRTSSNRQARNSSTTSQASTSRVVVEKKPPPVAVTTPASRPSTPSIPVAPPEPSVPTEVKTSRAKKDVVSTVRETASPAPSVATESDVGSAPPEPLAVVPSRPASAADSVLSSIPDIVPIPSVPPGLTAPPGIPSPSRPPRLATDLPQTPLLATQSAYFDKMNPSVRDMIEEVKDRRGSSAIISPFPDFDKTLQTLSENDGGFSFNLDPKLAEGVDSGEPMAEFEAEASTPFHGTYLQAFPALQAGTSMPAPPGLSYPSPLNRGIYSPLPPRPIRNSPLSSATNYMGSFDPFAEVPEDGGSTSTSLNSQLDDDRKVSRFGFARGRPPIPSAASSPRLAHAAQMQPLGIEEPTYPPRWASPAHGYGVHHTPPPMAATSSHGPSPPVGTRFQPFDGELGEAQLREFIQASRIQASREKELEMEAHSLGNQGFNKSHQPFQDPAIMSASFGPSPEPMFSPSPYGPPPGLPASLAVPPGLSIPSGVPPGLHLNNGMASDATVSPSTSSPAPSLSAADFPALVSHSSKEDPLSSASTASLVQHKASASRKAAKRTAADKQLDKGKQVQVKAAISSSTSGHTIPVDTDTSSDAQSASVAVTPVTSKPGTPHPDLKLDPKVPTTKSTKSEERSTRKAKQTQAKSKATNETSKAMKHAEPTPLKTPSKDAPRSAKSAPSSIPPELPVMSEVQVPILSKKPKKNKPVSRAPKPLREDTDDSLHRGQGTDSNLASVHTTKPDTPSSTRSQEGSHRLSLEELLEQITQMHPPMDLAKHPFFDTQRLGTIAKMPLEYGPLVHALSALSVGGGSFANNVPSGSIDTAVSSFQQLLETLTQTISDLLRLLPRTTWDDSSSFDSVLRDMLKGDEFLDEAGEAGQERDDEVAALTLALERRARWMEVQLSKLEELHRDINTAAVRAVLSFNDNGWDKEGFLPRSGDTLRRFDDIAFADEEDYRYLGTEELERRLAMTKEAADYAEAEVRESMNRFQFVKEFDNDFS